jgi:hypothetical protein
MNHIDWSTGGGGIGFGAYGPADELLHPQVSQPGDTVSETWLYMWYVPEERISCIAYVWVHTNLGVLTSGLTVYQGHKDHPLEAEIFDIRAYLSASIVRDGGDGGDGRDVRIPNGMRIHLVDQRDRTYRIHGTMIASTSWSPWPNMQCRLGLARWEMDEEVGWGDIQEVHSGDYMRALNKEPSHASDERPLLLRGR